MIKKIFPAIIIGFLAGSVMALVEFTGPLKNIRDQDWTASRLAYITDANDVNSVLDLTVWIGGTPNQVYVTDDGDGSLTINLPQDVNIVSWPTFLDVNLTSLTASRLVASDAQNALVSSDLINWVATNDANYLTVTDDLAGGVILDVNVSGIVSGAETDPCHALWLAGPPNVSEFTNDAGYLTTYSETDPCLVLHNNTFDHNDIADGATAYSWGNHDLVGYLTAETDPCLVLHNDAFDHNDIADGATAYGWGNHALAGYGDMTKAVYDVLDDGFVDGNDTAYAASWNGNINAPSMNAIYDAAFLTTIDYNDANNLYLAIDGSNANTTINIQTQDLTGIDQLVIGNASSLSNIDFLIDRANLNTASAYTGAYFFVEKTAGATNQSTSFAMLGFDFYMDQLNGEIGNVYGLDFDIAINEGQVGDSASPREVVGLGQDIWIGDGATDVNVWGDVLSYKLWCRVDSDANITGDLFGLYNKLDIAAGAEIGDDIYGYYGYINEESGTADMVYMMYLADYTNVDYCIYQDGTAPSVFGGIVTIGSLVIGDANYIGSASDTDAIQIEADGDIVMSQDLAVTGVITATGVTELTDNSLQINTGGSGNRFAFIDFVGDDTYTDYGLRIIRNNTGINTTSQFTHRGTGGLFFICDESSPVVFHVDSVERFRISDSSALSEVEIQGNAGAKLGDIDANYVDIAPATGHMTFVGDATVWDDIRITPGSFDRPGASDPAYYLYDVNGSGTTIALTEWALNDYATFTVQMPHSYREGSNISMHVHWTPGANGAGESGNYVGWKIIYSWTNIDGTFPNPATADLSDVCDGTNHKHQMTPSVAVTGTGKTISSMLICKITRTDTGADDTWAGAGAGNLPLLLEADFHFEIDSIGSNSVLTK